MPARLRFLDLAVFGAQQQLAAAGHGVAGIDAEVEQHLMDLRSVAASDPELRLHVFLELDVFGERFADYRFSVAEQVFELDDFMLAFGAPGEGENLTDQFGAAPHAAIQCVEQILVIGAGEAVAEHGHGHHDGREDVIEVVGNAAGEHADVLQPL